MRIGKIVVKIRAAKTHFEDMVCGAAELNLAMAGTLQKDMAFVIPLVESVQESRDVNIINIKLVERFGIVVAIANDDSQAEKLGVTAYDQLHDIREELFECLLGWEISEAQSLITYRGGKLITLNGAYLWYQFEFEYTSLLGQKRIEDDMIVYGSIERTVTETPPNSFDRIYANYILAPSSQLPVDHIPLADGYPNVRIPDMAQLIDLTDNPLSGGFSSGFISGFDIDKT